MARNPEHQRWLESAAAAIDMKEYGQALELLGRLVEAIPADPEPYLRRGIVYARKKENLKAVVDFTEALRLSPQNREAYFNRGVVYANMERHERALADFSRALAIDPAMGEALDARGDAYYRQREYNRALADYNSAIAAYASRRHFDQAWQVVHKMKQMGWDIDRNLLRGLVRVSGRRS